MKTTAFDEITDLVVLPEPELLFDFTRYVSRLPLVFYWSNYCLKRDSPEISVSATTEVNEMQALVSYNW